MDILVEFLPDSLASLESETDTEPSNAAMYERMDENVRGTRTVKDNHSAEDLLPPPLAHFPSGLEDFDSQEEVNIAEREDGSTVIKTNSTESDFVSQEEACKTGSKDLNYALRLEGTDNNRGVCENEFGEAITMNDNEFILEDYTKGSAVFQGSGSPNDDHSTIRLWENPGLRQMHLSWSSVESDTEVVEGGFTVEDTSQPVRERRNRKGIPKKLAVVEKNCSKLDDSAVNAAICKRSEKVIEKTREHRKKQPCSEKYMGDESEKFICGGCGKTYSSIKTLHTHHMKRNGCKGLKCHICGLFFEDSKKLSSHVCGCGFDCSFCGKNFKNKQLRKQHEGIHSTERNYICTICGKSFHVQSSLCSHMSTHATIKPYSCQVCEKKFAKQRNLQLHSRIHANEKPFECTKCGKKFSQSSNRAAHVRIHNKEQPHICHFCNKSFTHKSTLASHLRTHTKNKPYACATCNKSFSHRGSLKNHQLVHTKEKKFACAFCEIKFAHRQSWAYHENNHKKLGHEKAVSAKQSAVIVRDDQA